MAQRPRALILRSAGINCDEELSYAFELAGASSETIHLRELMDEPTLFDEYDLIGFPGGFSFGDDVAGGAIFAMLVRERLYSALVRCIDRGTPIFAVCNGFQVAVKTGLLPGPSAGIDWPVDHPPEQRVTLTENAGGRFIDDWVEVEVNPDSPCIWTRGLDGKYGGAREMMMVPIAHGEGRFTASEEVIAELESTNRVALRYADGCNVNGSVNRIAGICDGTGLIFGLMPHPERYVLREHHPFWSRLSEDGNGGDYEPIGLRIFRNAVEYAREKQASRH